MRKAMFECGIRFCVYCRESEIAWVEKTCHCVFVKWIS